MQVEVAVVLRLELYVGWLFLPPCAHISTYFWYLLFCLMVTWSLSWPKLSTLF